jgi:hypothetical protein
MERPYLLQNVTKPLLHLACTHVSHTAAAPLMLPAERSGPAATWHRRVSLKPIKHRVHLSGAPDGHRRPKRACSRPEIISVMEVSASQTKHTSCFSPPFTYLEFKTHHCLSRQTNKQTNKRLSAQATVSCFITSRAKRPSGVAVPGSNLALCNAVNRGLRRCFHTSSNAL